MTQIIDRRLNSKNKSAVNRQRFLTRFRKQIKEAVSNAISKRNITDIAGGEKITIPTRDIKEPKFTNGDGGKREYILPGNQDFAVGDRIKRDGGKSKSDESKASKEGEGVDNFVFELSKREFMDMFFEDLALPDLVKTKLQQTTDFKSVRGGYVTQGVPSNIDYLRSFRNAMGRRIAFAGKYKKRLAEAIEERDELLKAQNMNNKTLTLLLDEITHLEAKIASVPFIDKFDIRYSNKIRVPENQTSAVMFCIMDVSGSMDEAKKSIAKRFFILLYLFLTKTYEKIDLVFIRHHTTAKEVTEKEFFYSRETGGTVVSSALECMRDILLERYNTDEWNIYAAQASDGDNWNADSPLCQSILNSEIMPYLQYFSYVEIMPRHHQSLWRAYLQVKALYPKFAMRSINNLQDIYPIFHELFKRKTT